MATSQWRMPCPVDGITREGAAWRIATPMGAVRAESVVIATGGLTVPKIGATPFGYRIAEQFGLAVVAPSPALVPLALPPDALARYGDLAGVAVDVEVTCGDGRFRENLLFTHRGLSGPAILQISSYWNGKAPLVIDVLPGIDADEFLGGERTSPARLDNVLARRLPQRFAQAWCAANESVLPMKQLPEKRLRDIAAQLQDWALLPSGTLGYNKAEVTLGGVDTRGSVEQIDGRDERPGTSFHRRSRRCDGLARRIQLPVGMVVGARGRDACMIEDRCRTEQIAGWQYPLAFDLYRQFTGALS